jgi:hypothetical protein
MDDECCEIDRLFEVIRKFRVLMVTRVLTNKSSCLPETISKRQKGDLLNLSDPGRLPQFAQTCIHASLVCIEREMQQDADLHGNVHFLTEKCVFAAVLFRSVWMPTRRLALGNACNGCATVARRSEN